MTFQELKDKALTLPLAPGVYIMRGEDGSVIYVGKAKKLKNRVSQYFQDSASHTPKTRAMISKIHSFDVIVASSEFEALVLECSLIKRHMPKYNILLKDDKGYPYLRLDMKELYPRLTMVNKMSNDGAEYYGPYGSRGVTQSVLDTIRQTFRLPGCSKQFPRDVGKDRPCLNYHMDQCLGWCQVNKSRDQYRQTMEQVRMLLSGHYQKLVNDLKEQMIAASESLAFEQAAELRDRMKAVEALGKKQLVSAGTMADTDVIGFYQSETKACFVVLHLLGGNLLDKEYQILMPQDDPQNAVGSLVKQYYLARGFAPKIVLLPCEMEDGELFSDLLFQNFGKRSRFRIPVRGDGVRLAQLAHENAMQEAERLTSREEKANGALLLLGKLLSLEAPPRRLEAFDISNLSGTDIVASMVVFVDGKPYKKDYKRFKIKDLSEQDDYASMKQVVTRRFERYLKSDAGFNSLPDVLLIDGGVEHAEIARTALEQLSISVPVFGMVKDDRHRTRALVTPEGNEISIAAKPAVFALIGTIQEETHRFAITYNRELRSKRLKRSQLDGIPGIGTKRKEELLKHFKSIRAIKQADLQDLLTVLPKDAAAAVYAHFHREDEPCES